jgi:hypothetical protein
MGKRVAPDERPYRPVEEALVRSVLDPQDDTSLAEPPRTNGLPHVPRSQATEAIEELPRQGILAGIHDNGHDSSQTPTAEKLSREKRVLLTLAEEREIERLVGRVADELATPVKLSHMLRAYMTLLLHAEGEITKRARQTGPLHRPPNGDAVALTRFEHQLAKILSAAFRDAPPLR